MSTLSFNTIGRDAPAPAWSEADLAAMREATQLAWRGAGRTGSNPMVGSVVVADGRTIATGFHGEAGLAHAEVIALDAAGDAARGATLYASLEPCAHHGRTPPCTDRIIAAGVSRVVIPALDPDPRVMGRGVEVLRAAGIRVDTGCLAGGAVLDNLGYYRDRLGLAPTVTIKMALSRDGMVSGAPGRRDAVTGEAARAQVHALRAVHDAVLVGVETVLADSPRLDCRLLGSAPRELPVPVVLDSRLRTPADNAWSRAGRAFVVVGLADADDARAAALAERGGTVLRCPPGPGGVDVRTALGMLAAQGLGRILVEGGPRVAASFVDAGAWDAAWYFHAPLALGAGGVAMRPAGAPGEMVDSVPVGTDTRVRTISGHAGAALVSAFRSRTAA